jgi:PAS domain S-box-containing protein
MPETPNTGFQDGTPAGTPWETAETADREAILGRVLDTVADAILIMDSEGLFVYSNAAARRLSPEAPADGERLDPELWELTDANWEPLPLEQRPYDRVLRSGVPVVDERVGWIRPDGTRRMYAVNAVPMQEEDGTVSAVVFSYRDITDQWFAESAQQFLVEAGELLASSLDYETTLRSVAALAVPRLGDWCTVHVVEESGEVRQLAVTHADPAKIAWALELQKRYPPDWESPRGLPNVIRTGRSESYPVITDEMLVAGAQDEEHLRILREVGMRSAMIVPLNARGRTVGAVSFISAESGRGYTARDLALAETLAHRAALAIDNARLYAESQRAGQRAEEARALLDTLLEAAPIGFAFLDREMRYVRINRALAEINGKTPQESIGRTGAEVIPHLWPTVEPIYRSVLETGDPCLNVEMSGATASLPGVMRHFLSSYYPVRTADGVIVGLGIIGMEITERKETEERIARGAAEVHALNEQLRWAMTETHHRVKNNLQIMAAMVDMQIMEGGETVPARELRRLVSHISTLAVVHDILTHKTKVSPETHLLSARELLEKLLPLLRQVAGDRRIDTALDDAELSVRQATSLALVTNELVSNALKHSEGPVTVRLTVGSGEAVLDVTDEGAGFPPEFNAAEAANTGLELVENLSRWDLNGSIQYLNRPKGGGVVRITFPSTPL